MPGRPNVDALAVGFDGESHVLGRPDLGIYVAVPHPGVVLVETLQRGASLAEAVAAASRDAGEPVDGEDFLAQLDAAGLLVPGRELAARGDVGGWRALDHAARRLFGPVAWAAYCAAAVACLVAFAAQGDLRPTWRDAWFLDDPILSVLAYWPVAYLLAALHEAWHWLAGRAVGVPARFRVSNRGIYLVFETDLSDLVALPRRRRYGPFLAGMAADTVVLAAALGLRLLGLAGVVRLPRLADGLLAAVVLYQVLGIVWQWAALFMRNDGYAVLANALGCHNLYRATWLTAKRRLAGLRLAESEEFAGIGARDRAVARWFAWVYLAGLAVMLWTFLRYGVPFLAAILRWTVGHLAGGAVTTWAYWESLAAVAYVAVHYGLPPVVALWERRRRRAGVLR